MDEKIMQEIQVQNTENAAENTPHVSNNISETVNGTEIETFETQTEESTQVASDTAFPADAGSLNNDVHIIMVILVLMFVTGCMRAWRQFAVKGVK